MTVTCSPQEAAALVRRRDTIGFGLGPGNPDAFLTALGERDDWEDLVLGGALLLGYYTVLTKRGVSYRSGFFGPAERILLAEGHDIELVPGGFRQFAPILARFAPRIMTAQAAPPDAHGRVNLSLHLGATRDELMQAGTDPDRVLLVEVNPHLPRTRSLPAFRQHAARGDHRRARGGGRCPVCPGGPGACGRGQGHRRTCAAVRADGSTLQIGIGAVPNMVATTLADGAGGDYGVHSEMFTTGLMRLHEAGKVTNARKGVFDGVSVTTFALGTADLYRWLDGNAEVAFLPVDIVNDPTVIGRNRQVGVHQRGAVRRPVRPGGRGQHRRKPVSGVGGHEDFVAGAELHVDSRSLVCLPSTVTTGGAVRSRIVPLLPEGPSSPPRGTTPESSSPSSGRPSWLVSPSGSGRGPGGDRPSRLPGPFTYRGRLPGPAVSAGTGGVRGSTRRGVPRPPPLLVGEVPGPARG